MGVLARAGTTSVDGFRIRTNDPAFAGVPRVSIGDVSIAEGTQAAPGTATLTLTLSQAATVATSVAWRTVDGTAVAGADYASRSGTATFAAGATTAQIVSRWWGIRPESSTTPSTSCSPRRAG